MKQELRDYTDSYTKWNPSMKDTYKILVPDMLPWHFMLISEIFKLEGFDVEVLKNDSRTVIDEGLKHVHNDTCYPCLCVVGQYIDALKSGKYDLNKTAVMITQTGGGCRASNYLPLVRKALHAEFPQVPVLSLNFSGLEKDSSFPITVKLFLKLAYAILYSDTMMWCFNQTKPYEVESGACEAARDQVLQTVVQKFKRGGYKKYKDINRYIINTFAAIPRREQTKIKVGIVGEIYVKYSHLGNNNLEKFLLSEGCEPIVPTLMDFILFIITNTINDRKLYGRGKVKGRIYQIVYNVLYKMTLNVRKLMIEQGTFAPIHDMEELRRLADEVINQGVKMGEGWLIPAEMAALYQSGVPNVVCAQPFGCLPNHIAGKGAIRSLKQLFPDINVVAVDYDPSATKVNQENRIKLMLATARENEGKTHGTPAASGE